MSHEVEFVPPKEGEGYDHQEPQAATIGILAVITIVGLLAVLIGVQAYFEHVREQQITEKVLVPVGGDLVDLRQREDAALKSYSYFDKAKGQVRLPIDRAMELLAQESKAGKIVQKATPVKPPEPAAAPAPGTPNVAGKAN